MLSFDPIIVADLLLNNSLIQHFELVSKDPIFGYGGSLILKFGILVIHLPYFLSLFFPLIFLHWVVSQFRDNLKHHVPDICNLRGVELRALLNPQVWRVKADCCEIASSCVTIKAYLVTILQVILFHLWYLMIHYLILIKLVDSRFKN